MCVQALVNLVQSQSPQNCFTLVFLRCDARDGCPDLSLWAFWSAGFSFSHRCASVVRMSACSFCCSFVRWFKLLLFSLFFVGYLSFWCRGYSGTLFVFSAWMGSLAYFLLSSASAPEVFSISAVGVVFVAPKIVLKPMFWTLSSLLVCVSVAVAQALAPYSRDGRTAPM